MTYDKSIAPSNAYKARPRLVAVRKQRPIRIYAKILCGFHSKLFHQLIQRRPADTEFHSGGSDFPAVTPQSILNHLAFHSFPRLLQASAVARRSGYRFNPDP